jgi:hypothetical protein
MCMAEEFFDIRKHDSGAPWPLHQQGQMEMKGRGRWIAAERDLEAGELLLFEGAAVSVLYGRWQTHLCMCCMRPTSSPALACGCGEAVLCSEKCASRMNLVHLLECGVMQTAGWNTKRNDSAIHLRLLLRVGTLYLLSQYDRAGGSQIQTDGLAQELNHFRKNYAAINRLVTNRHSFPEARLAKMSSHAQAVLQSLWINARKQLSELMDKRYDSKEEMVKLIITENEAVDILCAIQCNTFEYSNIWGDGRGIGLFPAASLLNHSCEPNACTSFCPPSDVYDTPEIVRPVIAIRALKNIRKNEEVTISYIDLYQSTNNRQRQLLAHYYFVCQCIRCTSYRQMDNCIDAYTCSRRWPSVADSGFIFLDLSIPFRKSKEDNCEGFFVEHRNLEGMEEHRECNICGIQENETIFNNLENQCMNALERILFPEQGNSLIGSRRYDCGRLDSWSNGKNDKEVSENIRKNLEQLLHEVEQVLHPLHRVLVKIFTCLARCSSKLDHTAAIDYYVKAISNMETIFPTQPNSWLSSQHYSLATIKLMIVSDSKEIRDGTSERQILKQCLEHYTKAYDGLLICVGEEHELVKKVKERISLVHELLKYNG